MGLVFSDKGLKFFFFLNKASPKPFDGMSAKLGVLACQGICNISAERFNCNIHLQENGNRHQLLSMKKEPQV